VAAATGSTEAFAELVRLHQARIRAYIGRFLRGNELVDDLAQETFVAAFRGLGEVVHDAPFRLWLLGIARHKVLDHLREKARQAGTKPQLELAWDGWLAERLEARVLAPEQERRFLALETCVESLTADRAGMLRSYYVEQRSARQIGTSLGLNENAVRVTLFRIRRFLRACVERRLAHGEAPA